MKRIEHRPFIQVPVRLGCPQEIRLTAGVVPEIEFIVFTLGWVDAS